VLADVEMVCDQVALIVDGSLREMGPLTALLSPKALSTDVVIEGGGDLEVPAGLDEAVTLVRVEDDGGAWFSAQEDAAVDALVHAAVSAGLRVRAVVPHKETLEDLFVRETAK
jgi:ABC-type uncharacterized transport system ATPase subunit